VLVLWIPPSYLGMLLSLVYSSWLTSLYCFEYTWLNAGWNLNRRLEYFERHWAYFLGFGLPFTAATYFLSFLYRSDESSVQGRWELLENQRCPSRHRPIPLFSSTGTFALFFPIFIIIATVAEPLPRYSQTVANLAHFFAAAVSADHIATLLFTP
jgi:etoposide-induced 2.4 mRNA